MNVHQILPNISRGDAIGNEVLLLQKLFRESGYTSDIFCEAYHPDVNARVYQKYTSISSKENILIYHHSIGSPIADFITGLPDQKIMIYHNITSSSYFEGIDDHLAYLLQKGRTELPMLAPYFQIALGDSEFNRKELEECGYENTEVLPVLIDFNRYPDPCLKTLAKYSDGKTNILFVGRISPNKRFEDIIKSFYYYKKINPSARLLLPGSYAGMEIYYQSLLEIITGLGLTDVIFPGKVNFNELVAYYQVANTFLCMSEHEGFNVPIVECMHFGVPVIAYNSCAIPYTLGNAGILINEKKYEEISELIDIVLNDDELKTQLVKTQFKRLKEFDYKENFKKFLHIITGIQKNMPS